MRNGFLGSITTLLAGAGLALAQQAVVQPPTTTPASPGGMMSPYASAYPAPATHGVPVPDHEVGEVPDDGGPGGLTKGCLDGPPADKCQFYARGEYLLWKVDNAALPPLLANVPAGMVSVFFQTLSNVAPTTQNFQVNLPLLATTNFGIPGGNTVAYNEQSGGRLTVGYWVEPCLALELSGFFLSPKNIDFNNNTGTTPLSFPTSFVNTTIAVPTGNNGGPPLTTTSPAITLQSNFQATIHGTSSTEMYGGEFDGRCQKLCIGPVAFDGLVGLRYINLQEGLDTLETVNLTAPTGITNINTATTPQNLTAVFTVPTIVFADDIRTRNQFYGAQVGCSFRACWGCWTLDGWGKLGVGDMHQAVDLLGFHTGDPFGLVPRGGLLSQAPDFGHHERDRCAFVPETNFNLGYKVCPNCRLFVGYSFMWLSSVARPGDQTQFTTSTATVTIGGTPQTISVANPGFRFNSTDVWVQGCNFGVEFCY